MAEPLRATSPPLLPLSAPAQRLGVSPAAMAPVAPSTSTDHLQGPSTASGSAPATGVRFLSATEVIARGKLNTTATYSKAQMPVPIKEALKATLELVAAVDPERAKTLAAMEESDFLLADDGIKDMFAKHDIYAAWAGVIREKGSATLHFGSMVLDDRFWKLRDAEKASVLIHETIHAEEIPVISHVQKLVGVVGNRIKGDYGDPVEDRAYLHQHTLFEALGIGTKDEIFWTVQTYLEDRKMIPPYKF